MDDEMITVCTVQGEAEETQIRTFLRAHGIPSTSWGEALRKTHGFVLDGLGEVQIQVPAEFAEQARELIAAVDRGEMSLDSDELPESE
jgi:hypothetical protein